MVKAFAAIENGDTKGLGRFLLDGNSAGARRLIAEMMTGEQPFTDPRLKSPTMTFGSPLPKSLQVKDEITIEDLFEV